MKRIAKFEKVSFEEFMKAIEDIYPDWDENYIRTHAADVEEAARFMLEVAKAYGRKQCSFYDTDEYARLQKLYGSMKHLQTLGNE